MCRWLDKGQTRIDTSKDVQQDLCDLQDLLN